MSTDTLRSRRLAVPVVSLLASEAITVALLLGPLLDLRWWEGFRAYFSNDQLSYAAIATNVDRGNLALVEPLTGTGNLFYPSAWYQFLGGVARLTGLPIGVVWTLLGIAIACTAIGFTGWTAYRLSGRWFAPLLPGLLLLTGSLSTVMVGYWYTPISAHAVLWGPYGTLFTLNAENAGLSLAIISICLLLLATRSARPASRVLTAAFLVGLLANVQTYTFFTALSLIAIWAAVMGGQIDRSRRGLWLSGTLIAILLVGGSRIAEVTGPLPMFGLLLAALTPVAFPSLRRHLRLTIAAVALTAVAAAPQIVRTVIGLMADDPFLTYRAASTKDLGVPVGTALLSALPLLLIGLACALPVMRARVRPVTALLLAWPVGWLIMTANDRWGFTQEPYRFWIQYVVIGTVLASVVIAVATNGLRGLTGVPRACVIAGAAFALIAWLVSLSDLRGWWEFARAQGIISTADGRSQAIRGLVNERPGLFAAAPCIDPQVLKLLGADRVAHYNKGLAWPDRVADFEIFQDPGRRTIGDPIALRAAAVDFVVADSACPEQWTFSPQDLISPIATAPYTMNGVDEQITLLRVLPR